MLRLLSVAIAGFIGGALLLAPMPASAISDADACAADGGTYSNDSGTKTCTYPVGNSHNTKKISQKGSFGSNHDESYTNPNGNQPPGKQGGDELQ